MDHSLLPAPITFNTPTTSRRLTGLAAVASTIGEMVPLPSAPVQKNGLVPLVGKANGVSDNAKIDSLLVEVEKLSSKVGVLVAEIEKVSVIMNAVGDDALAVVADVAPVAPVPLDVAHTLAMHEMRMILTTEQSQMRVYMRNLAIAMALVVFVMSIVVMIAVYAIVYRLKEPAVCESFPSVLPTMYDNMKCCARMFSEDSS
jgi:outer membrane murein-binding lipoprotein Lpp